jgi:phage FluMu protein Com
VDVRDVRRLATSALVIGAAVLLWLLFLALDQEGAFEWSWPSDALETLPFIAWMWICFGLLAFLLVAVAAPIYGMSKSPGGKTPTRQVQCQDCKAVFFMPDNGRRPLTYPCPSCKALGVYDGQAAPIGQAPVVPAQNIKRVNLTCRSCQTKFLATDTGVRPLHVTCPSCKAVGLLR